MSSNTNIGNTPVNQGYVQLIHMGETGGIDGTLRALYDGDGTASDLLIASDKVKISTELYIGSKTLTEFVQDTVGVMLTTGSYTNITTTYDDTNGNIDLNASGDVTLSNSVTLSNKTLAAPILTGTTQGASITLSGDLTVNGTTTTVNQTNLDVSDNIIGLNRGAGSNANDSGIIIERGSTGNNAAIIWDESADKFTLGTTTSTPSATGDLTISTGTLVANLEGAVTGNVTGSASLNLLKSSNLSDLASASTARSNLGVDAAGTDNSTNVTLAGSLDYITLSGQQITRNAINLTTDVSGTLPVGSGGTGATTLTNNSVLTGTGTSAITAEGNLTFNGNKLNIESSENVVLSMDTTSTSTFLDLYNDNTNRVQIGNARDGDFIIRTNDVERFTIDKTTGNIGMGTNDPTYDLDVAGDIGVNQYIYHNADVDTFINFTADRVRIDAGGTTKFDSNNTYVETTRSITPVSNRGISGGGDLSADRTIELSSSQLGSVALTTSDQLILFDASDSDIPKRFIAQDIFDTISGAVTSYTNTGDNRVLTSVGGTTINGEANLTFDGDFKVAGTDSTFETISFDGSNGYLLLSGTASQRMEFRNTTTNANGWIGIPSWNTDAFYAYLPTASANELAYIYESSRHNLYNDVALQATKKLYFDGGGNTYIDEPSGDQLRLVAGGTEVLKGYSGGAIDMYGGSINRSINIGANRTADAASFIDLVGDTTYTDYGARLIRNSGANAITDLTHRGTGALRLRCQDAGAVLFMISDAEKMRVASSGNVGIGTTSPAEELDVNGVGKFRGDDSEGLVLELGQLSYNAAVQAVNISYFDDTSGGSSLLTSGDHLEIHGGRWGSRTTITRGGQGGNVPVASLYGAGSHSWLELYQPDSPTDSQAYTTKIRLRADGDSYITNNLGIGTTSPASKLHIQEATAGTPASTFQSALKGGLILEDDNTTTANNILIKSHSLGNDEAIGGIKFVSSPDGGNYSWAGIQGLVSTFAAAGQLAFYTAANNTAGATSTERMRIDSSGNVGIGTTSPAYKLHLEQAGGVMQQLKATDSAQSYMKFVNSTTGDGQFSDGFLFGLDSDETIAIWNYEATAMRFATSGAEKMRIDSAGRVMIGDTSVHYTGVDLQVGSTSDGQNGIQIQTSTTGYGYVLFGDGTGASAYRGQISYKHGDDFLNFLTAGVEAVRIDSSQDAHFDQDVIAFSTTPSDIRLKENFEKIENGLDVVKKLEGHTFNWKKGGDRLSAGFKAQEVEKILPHLVDEKKLPLKADDDKEYKILRYEEMIPYLVEAIKEQQDQINELKGIING